MNLRILNFAALVGVLALAIYTLIIGRTLLLPFVSAIVIWYLIIRLTDLFQALPIIPGGLPYPIALLFSFVATGFLLYFFFNFLASSIAGIINEAPKYQDKLQYIVDRFNEVTKIEFDLGNTLAHINISNIFSTVALTCLRLQAPYPLL